VKPAQAQQQPKQLDRKDPKWVESLQRLLKDLTDDNAKLRSENEGLRADVDALTRKLETLEARERQLREQRGAFVLPPELLVPSPQGPRSPQNTIPPNARPRQFNGATYYIIPCKDGGQVRQGAAGEVAKRLMLEQPPQPK